MINRTKVKESTQIKPGDNGDVLVMKDNAPEWSTPSDAGLAEQANVDSELSKKQDKLVAGDNIHIDGNTISADGKPTPINIGTVISGEVPMVSNSGTDTDVVLNFVLPKGDKGDPGKDGTQVNNISPVVEDIPPSATGNMSLAAGESARSTEYAAVAIGSNARAGSSYGVAIGFGAATNGTNGIAVGQATNAAEDGISFGWSAHSGNQGVAIGRSSSATVEKSVAIGSFSQANEANTVSIGNGDGGSDPATRRLVNVTDPQNAQDAATKNYVDTKISEIPTGTAVNNIAPLVVDTAPTSSNPGSVVMGSGAISRRSNEAGITIGENAYGGMNGGTVIGVNARGDDNQGGGVVIGDYAFGTRGVNIGSHASVRPTRMPSNADSIGSYAEVPSLTSNDYDYCVALGSYSVATEGRTVSVGSGVTTLTLSDDMTEEQQAIARSAYDVPTRRIVNVTDPRDAQDAATKNYVDTQLEPVNAKLQYVPENTNQILSQIQTNVEKAQSTAEAKVASITAGTGISVDDSNPTAPVVSTVGLATQSSVDALTTTVNSKANQTDLEALQTTVAGKADTSALDNYATKSYVDNSALQCICRNTQSGVGDSLQVSVPAEYQGSNYYKVVFTTSATGAADSSAVGLASGNATIEANSAKWCGIDVADDAVTALRLSEDDSFFTIPIATHSSRQNIIGVMELARANTAGWSYTFSITVEDIKFRSGGGALTHSADIQDFIVNTANTSAILSGSWIEVYARKTTN